MKRFAIAPLLSGDDSRKKFGCFKPPQRVHQPLRVEVEEPDPILASQLETVPEPPAKRSRSLSSGSISSLSSPAEADISVSPSKPAATFESLTFVDPECDYTPLPQSLQSADPAATPASAAKFKATSAALMASTYWSPYPNFENFDHKMEAMLAVRRERQLHGTATHVPLFARQIGTKGNQSFVVAGYGAFLRRYQNMAPHERVYYEMFQPDSLVKCFTDYDSTTNDMTMSEFARRVSLLNGVISEQLMQQYGVKSSVVILSSSQGAKLSRHCIWNMGGKVSLAFFRNVYHLKSFITHCALVCARRFPSLTEHKVFGILDMNVYKPGAYRLYGSTKLGQDRFLVHQEDYPSGNVVNEKIFYDSLVQHFATNAIVQSILKCEIPLGSSTMIRRSKEESSFASRSGINALPMGLLRRILETSESGNSDHALVCKRWLLALTGVSMHGLGASIPLIDALRNMLRQAVGPLEAAKVTGKIKEFQGFYG